MRKYTSQTRRNTRCGARAQAFSERAAGKQEPVAEQWQSGAQTLGPFVQHSLVQPAGVPKATALQDPGVTRRVLDMFDFMNSKTLFTRVGDTGRAGAPGPSA